MPLDVSADELRILNGPREHFEGGVTAVQPQPAFDRSGVCRGDPDHAASMLRAGMSRRPYRFFRQNAGKGSVELFAGIAGAGWRGRDRRERRPPRREP